MAIDEVQATGLESAKWPWPLRWLLDSRVFWCLMAGIAALRIWTASSLNLAQDEAYYWVWSRHLSWSYFDHPPMVAWLIRASTGLLGDSEFAVRLPAVVMSLASIPIIMWGVRSFSAPAAKLTGAILLLGPPTALAGSIITPDAPVWFFGSASIALALRATNGGANSGVMWMAFGACLGLGLVSKYTAATIGPCVVLALLTSGQGRSHLRRPAFWIGAVIAGVIFVPVVWWNARHDWASFSFQLRHGLSATGVPIWKSLGDFVGGMMLAWTPVLFILTSLAVSAHLRSLRRAGPGLRILMVCLMVPLLLFVFSATRRRVELNWPLLVVAPAAALTALYMLRGSRAMRSLGGVAIVLSAAATIGIQTPPVVLGVAARVRHLSQLFGYRELATEVLRLAEGRPVFANRYQDASNLMFYGAGLGEVWPLNIQSRPNAFGFFAGRRSLDGVHSAVLVNVGEHQVPAAFRVTGRVAWPTIVGGRTVRTDLILIVERIDSEGGP